MTMTFKTGSAMVALALLLASGCGNWALAKPLTYCNPLNVDYAFVPDKDYSHNNNCHRSTADPVCILYKDKYYLFATNQEGYWYSSDLSNWHFVSHFFKENASKDQVCAPAAWPTSKGVMFLPCMIKGDQIPLYLSTKPESGKWQELVAAFPITVWDPSFFEDDDKRLYIYWGSSNVYPIYGVELDPQDGYKPKGKPVELFKLDPAKHGWEQFGEDNQNGTMAPFIEGAWMNKFGGKYYLQYGAPGTEWNVYGDGVYVSDKPLGPFEYQKYSPFSWKPTGFIRGAGHGNTFADRYDNLWHAATMDICVKNTFERRMGLFPSGVDKDGVLFADTTFGDYPHFIASGKRKGDDFTGWMLLSYGKPCWTFPEVGNKSLAFDEDIKTFWTAGDALRDRFIAVDLLEPCTIRAVQINYADDQAKVFGKQLGKHHRYQVYVSDDKQEWDLLIDKSKCDKEVPHDYVELDKPVKARYLKLVNIEMPTGNFAISDLRVFGQASGAKPAAVKDFSVARDQSDRRNITFKWQAVPGAYAYNIRFGVAPDKLYNSMLIYDRTDYQLHSLNVDASYYFQIESVNRVGVSDKSQVVTAK